MAGRMIEKLFGKHPRLRGEDSDQGRRRLRDEETPPLTRGRRSAETSVSPVSGNTPAYAGKTLGFLRRAPLVGKHPRLRGEDLNGAVFVKRLQETPPLTRGRLIVPAGRYGVIGNTPAYAGKTSSRRSSSFVSGKHPRLRGEDLPPVVPPSTIARNTPAYAGKTFHEEVENLPLGKHPRLRGEDAFRTSLPYSVVETPPLTRGRPRKKPEDKMTLRNTPAYAGKTCDFISHLPCRWKHPRLRGEDRMSTPYTENLEETPPLTRGRLDRPCR